MDLKQESAKIQLRFLERVIGQAYKEGASVASIDAYLATQGVQDPDIWRARVEAKKITPMLGAQEFKNIGGRDAFRALFNLDPAPVVVAPSVQSDYPHTEMGDAECFAHLNADDLRYDHRQGRWLISDEHTGLWILGYSITGDCREECCFFAYGEGANGKGTIMNTVGWLLGDYRDDMPYATLEKNIYSSQGIPNDIAKLAGKRYVTCAEVQEFSINESRLKALTGRDPMTARFLNQEFFTFEPVCKIWIATNNKPRITGQDDGIWRRIHLIPFTNKFEGVNKDDTIKDRLRLEGPGILNWLVRGTQLWIDQGLNPPACVKAATEEYRLESDLLTPFVEQRCVIAPSARVQASHAWNEYQNFSQMQDDRMSDKAFHKAMKKRFQPASARPELKREGDTHDTQRRSGRVRDSGRNGPRRCLADFRAIARRAQGTHQSGRTLRLTSDVSRSTV
jgi:P4 family phage/plasmid primase-like protien